MKRDRAIAILQGLRLRLEARGIVHAALFGSVGRNEAHDASDIDVVVTPVSGRQLDLIELGGVQSLFEEGFRGLSVDVVVEPVTQLELKAAIQRDRVDAF